MKKVWGRLLVAVVFMSSMLAIGQATFAQGAANLSGIVRDSSGAAVPGASVAARNLATNQTRETHSDEQGRYAFPDLPIGHHEVTVSAKGFQSVQVVVELTIGPRAAQDINITTG